MEAYCYDSTGGYIDIVSFVGNTRGASVFDRQTMYLYHHGDIASYYIAPSDWPADTAKVKLYLVLPADGTVYVGRVIFSNVKYIPDHAFDGVLGLVIPPGEIPGDLPALCDLYISNPFTAPMWKVQNTGETVDIYGVHALDSAHGYACADDGYIFFYDGLLWATQDSGVSVPLNGVSAYDNTDIWTVGDNGTIRFSGNSSTWAGQTYPSSTPAIANMDLLNWDNGNPSWWAKTETTGTLVKHTKGAGDNCAEFAPDPATGNINVNLYSWPATTPFDTANSYTCSVVQAMNEYWQTAGNIDMNLGAYFYDSSGNYLGGKSTWFDLVENWTTRSISIGPSDYPAGTAKISLAARIAGTVQYVLGPSPLRIWVDDFSVTLADKPDLYSAHAISANDVVAVGQYGCIISTADGGTTWTRRTSGTKNNLNAVHYIAGTWYAVGDNGTILTSADGTTWVSRLSGWYSGIDLYGVYALDATHAWAVGQYGFIFFSADAGVTWAVQSAPTGMTLRSVYAFDDSNVWACGDDGTLLYFNSQVWSIQNSGTGKNLEGISGIDDANVWTVGDDGLVLKGIYPPSSLAITDLIIGEGDYLEGYNPVVECLTGDIGYDPYRRWGTYRELDAGESNKFLFNLLAHAGSRYAIAAGLTFSAATDYDKGTLHKFLQTVDGTAITPNYTEDEIDTGDPNTDWKEAMLLEEVWEDTEVATHVVSDDAVLSNMDQVLEMIAHASLGAVKLLLDYLGIIPMHRYVNISSIAANYLIIDSTMGYVFDSLDGGPSTAMVHSPQDVPETPRFVMDPQGCCFTIVAINDVDGDQRVGMIGLTLKYRPRYKLRA